MSAETIAADLTKDITVVGAVANGIDKVMPWLMLAGGFIPGADSVLAVLQIAGPIIKRIAAVAPIAVDAINAGAPVVAAIDKAGPSILTDLKDMLAIITNAGSGNATGTVVTGADISDAQAYAFAGPMLLGRQWTDEEMQRSWDRADGTARDGLGNRTDGW